MPISSSQSPEFDEFYLASRRRLVLQAYALTGDLAAARGAVRDAFVVARHHWRKVGRLPDPEEWVRPRAWAMAQRRHVARIWHREKGLSSTQKSVLDALHHLPDLQRKALLLAHLAGLSTPDIVRELGETRVRVETLLLAATGAFCERTECGPDHIRGSLESLAPVAEAAALPRPPMIHRNGRRRRQLYAVIGTVALIALTLVAGELVVRVPEPASGTTSPRTPRPVTRALMLNTDQVASLAPPQTWKMTSTSDNTTGTGINSVCQERRFADPDGLGTIVRTFAASGRPRRKLVQTIEISRSDQAAGTAYRTTLGWFAGCSKARVQLQSSYAVTGLGDEAQLLKLRIADRNRHSYVASVARTGSLTVSTVLETMDGPAVRIKDTADMLMTAVRNVCMSKPAGKCPLYMQVAPVLPPRSGETPGTLAAGDLPVIGRINRPWVGTEPVPARVNVAATTCDKANFVRAGAKRPMTRTFLIPQGKLPRRFGITETYGFFPSQRKAQALVETIRSRMASCEKRDLGAQVSNEVSLPRGYRGSELALWRLDSEINKRQDTVGFWMGVVRVGSWVAQVNFTPVGANDIDVDTFEALVIRARDRLFELSRGARR